MTKRNRSFFKAAKAMSELSDFHKEHLGCVVTCGSRIISSGCNETKTSPLQKELNALRFSADTTHSNHSEVKALMPLLHRKDINFKDCSIYVYREHRNGCTAIARPCKSCEKLIRDLGIKRIYYTVEDGFAEERWN